ncbi:MAG: HesA/MoeB/ThiF family protein [Deltaproteobacteria bacterium]|nr:HesA/MoeB/ThiF family protein [Deltaproteobacteria bacterium]
MTSMRSKTKKGDIQELIRSRSKKINDPAGRKTMILTDGHAAEIAERTGATVHDIYAAALNLGICPYRYLRNRETISEKDQLKLANSCVAVVGAGGLGGHVILLLARLGVGHIVVVDHDRFDETNLNRQALCTGEALGRSKSEEAVAVVGAINPGVRVTAHHLRIDSSNAGEVLDSSNVIVDALDTISDRFIIEDASRSLGIPLVHGALAGLEGQVMTIFPEDPGLTRLYGHHEAGGVRSASDRSQSPEAVLGVPALTPAFIATLQAMEVIKIILKRGKLLQNVMLHVDLETGDMCPFTFSDTD